MGLKLTQMQQLNYDSLEEKCIKHKSSPGVLGKAETDCQKYQHLPPRKRQDRTTLQLMSRKISTLLKR